MSIMSEGARESLAAEYVARAERLAPLLPALRTARPPHPPRAPCAPRTPRAPCATPAPRTRPLPADLAPNLALELTRSILYEDAESIDIQTLRSLSSHEESLWRGKPQLYFESMNYGHDLDTDIDHHENKDFESDSLAQ